MTEQWDNNGSYLQKTFTCADFKEALDIVRRISGLAEEVNHHPDITFGWGYVTVSLSTHSEHRVTDKDTALAARIDAAIA